MHPSVATRRAGGPRTARAAAAGCRFAAARWLAAAAAAALAAQALPAAERDGAVRFGVIADVQYADQPAQGTRFYRESLGKLAEAVADFNRRRPDFVVQLGDLIDGGASNLPAITGVFDRLAPTRYRVPGNHDFAGVPLPPRTPAYRLYYDFTRRNWRFVALDGMDVGVLSTADGSPEHEQAQRQLKAMGPARNAHPWNGALGRGQMAWLAQVLADADARQQRAVLFCHHPVYPFGDDNLWNDREVVALLEQHPSVAAWINGHNHAGGYGFRNGIHYLTVRGMVETSNTTAYAEVRAFDDRLDVDGVGRQPGYTLRLRTAPLRVIVFTGGADALGAAAAANDAARLPGADPADARVKFFWSNPEAATNAAAAGGLAGDSGGRILALAPQPAGAGAVVWGPELGCGRALAQAGVTNLLVIKAACAGGGNTLWLKRGPRPALYERLTDTVRRAVQALPARTPYEVVGLVYLQGEDDTPQEAAAAAPRVEELIRNLRHDLPNALGMRAWIVEPAGGGAARDTARTQQKAAAGRADAAAFVDADDLRLPGGGFDAARRLQLGSRVAAAILSAGSVP